MTWAPDLAAAVIAAVLAITLHEAAHGYAALALGDPTARLAGRLTLNPIRHVDPVGTLLVPGVLLLGQLLTIGRVEAMFGWAKPVPVDLRRLRWGLQGMGLVAVAGPAMNAALALVAAIGLHAVEAAAPSLPREAAEFLYRLVLFSILGNLVLGLFNLLPVLPLDGGRIVAALLPGPLAWRWLSLEPYGLFVVLGVVFLLPRIAEGVDPVGWLLRNVVAAAFDLVLRAAGHGGTG